MTSQIFQTYARYNAWMNENIYAGCANIPDDQRKKDMSAFFKSIHGTLNHLLIGDRFWLAQFTGTQLSGVKLDAILYENFDELWAVRRAMDRDITAFAAGLTDDWLAKPFTFKCPGYNREITHTTFLFVMHLFNHQTHHRGQVTTLMKQCGIDPGPTGMQVMPV